MGAYGMPQGMMLGNGAAGAAAMSGMMAAGPGQFYRVPQMPGDLTGLEEEPLYVNAKQYHRILKRRAARARMEAQLKVQREKRPYMHESRHRHAMRRPRGPGGRFLTATEIAELRAKQAAEATSGHSTENGTTTRDEADKNELTGSELNTDDN